MAKFLRPQTLYAADKFPQYVNQPVTENQKLKIVMDVTGKSATEISEEMLAEKQRQWEAAHGSGQATGS
jgi:hypothetical protein